MLRNTFTLKRLFDFRGRATRREYFTLLCCVVGAWFLLLLAIAAVAPPRAVGGPARATDAALGIFIMALAPISIVVMTAALVRRAHDHDKSWPVILLNMIPLVGWIFWLILTLTPGNRYENNYGPDPRDPIADEQGQLETIFS